MVEVVEAKLEMCKSMRNSLAKKLGSHVGRLDTDGSGPVPSRTVGAIPGGCTAGRRSPVSDCMSSWTAQTRAYSTTGLAMVNCREKSSARGSVLRGAAAFAGCEKSSC